MQADVHTRPSTCHGGSNSTQLLKPWNLREPLNVTSRAARVTALLNVTWVFELAPALLTRLLRSPMRLYAHAASSATSQERSTEAGRTKQLANQVRPNCRSASPRHGHPLHAIE